jgi:hypothetical protein
MRMPVCINAGPFGDVMTTVSSSEVPSLPWNRGWLRPRRSHPSSLVWSRVTTQFARTLGRGLFEPWCARLWSPGRLHQTTPLCHSPLPQDTVPCGVNHSWRRQSVFAGLQAARLSRYFDNRCGWRLLNPGGSPYGVNSPRLWRGALTRVADNALLADYGRQRSAHRSLQTARHSLPLQVDVEAAKTRWSSPRLHLFTGVPQRTDQGRG